MVDITYDMFFDRPGVLRKVRDGTKSSLSKMGAYVRRSAKGLIRKRKRTATPGQPPSSHAGWLRDLIFFGYDDSTESLVVGPKLFKRSSPPVPQLLEFGGFTVRRSTGERLQYAAFPYMQPALDKNIDMFAELFRGAVRS